MFIHRTNNRIFKPQEYKMTEELAQLLEDLKGRYNIADEDIAVVTQAIDTTVAEAVAEATGEGVQAGDGEEWEG
ncbi:MAG: hypothetical protein IKB97_05670 [Bacteroidaceae bacterium]|nr:hypothetical protein [Bacteroidaceae bacterium]